ncbi:glycosyltransferase [Paenibacillus oryzisoli]|uniref:glycosyltransferase family 2 protein n=1 Tax=Paenibacillus oryzisoli TaxID=1850517 RepID=UPI003D2A567E
MLVFVLESSDLARAHATKANLAYVAPEWNVQFVPAGNAEALNEQLRDYDLPFFITLQAGDLLHESFLPELAERLEALPQDSAGIIYERGNPEFPDAPLVWRTHAVQSMGFPFFPASDRLPFDTYMLHDTMFALRTRWTWLSVSSTWWSPHIPYVPKWQRKQEEWELVKPILEAALPSDVDVATQRKAKASPQISIALCTYNNADYLLWSIRSVLAQTTDDWELIIIDDASTDLTQTKLAYLRQDPRIRIFTNPVNLGKSHCLNFALSVCRAPWLVELDADDWLPPKGVRALLDSAQQTAPETSLLYGDYFEWTERARKGLIFGGIRKAPAVIEANDLLRRALPVAPRCYRVATLHKIGGWSVEAPYEGRLYEDFEIIVRLSQSSAFRYIAKPLYHRRIRASSITHLHSEKYAGWRNWMERGAPIHQGDEGDVPPSS